MTDIPGGITAPRGFVAGTSMCGIKKADRPDLALIVSETPAACAGMFTSNRITGAPVTVSRSHVRNGIARAIVANSGNANVCTGEEGLAAAIAMTAETAAALGCAPSEVLVASTGVIGRPFPVEKVLPGIRSAAAAMSKERGSEAARAIMTTDTVPKETAVEFDLGGTPVRIGAMAKGSGMIAPHLATMFCFITTDAAIEAALLTKALREAVGSSFNCITVDGDMSTSDTVIVLANGRAGNPPVAPRSRAFDRFTEALTDVCLRMATAVVRDGEGATKFITIRVTGAAGTREAREVGLAIANSSLVKTAAFGADPNWGRIICAAGYAGVPIEESNVTIAVDGIPLFECGKPVPFDEAGARARLAARDMDIAVDLGMGPADAVIYTSDLSYEYVKINAEYTT